jgi:hypothetical protein
VGVGGELEMEIQWGSHKATLTVLVLEALDVEFILGYDALVSLGVGEMTATCGGLTFALPPPFNCYNVDTDSSSTPSQWMRAIHHLQASDATVF